MSTSQILLSLGAILLLMIVSSTMNRTYLAAITQNVDSQVEVEANNYAQSMTEVLFGHLNDYDNIDQNLGAFNDVTDPDKRFTHVTTFGDTLYATVDIGNPQTLIHGVQGRRATITVHRRLDNGVVVPVVEKAATINPREL